MGKKKKQKKQKKKWQLEYWTNKVILKIKS